MSKKNAGLDFIEDPDALAGGLERAENFFDANKNLVFGVAGALVLGIAAFFGYRYYQSTQEEEAQNKLFSAVYKFEQDSTDLALNGTKKYPGALAIADEFSGTKTADIAHLIAGASLIKKGKYDEAIEHLEEFDANDLLVQARAYALIGDAYMEKKSYTDAADYYQKAAEYKPNKFYTPGYLQKLAIAYEQAKDNAKAIETYQEILDKYADATEAPNARKYKSMLEAQSGE
jgi:predicted negative regulator of RcsB-dependent stress response